MAPFGLLWVEPHEAFYLSKGTSMAVEPGYKEVKTEDFRAHLRNYDGFTKLFGYGAVACFVIGLIVILIIS